MAIRRRRNLAQVRPVNRSRRRAPRRVRASGPGIFARLFGAMEGADIHLEVESRVARDIRAVVWLTLAVLTYLSLGGGLGPFGVWWEQTFRQLFGIGIYTVPAIFGAVGVVMLTRHEIVFSFTKILGITLLIGSSLGIVHLSSLPGEMWSAAAEFGGTVGFVASVFFRAAFAELGANIVLFALFLISLLLTFGISISEVIDHVKAWVMGIPLPVMELEDIDDSPAVARGEKKQPEKDEKPAKDFVASVAKLQATVGPTKLTINAPASVKLAADFKPTTVKLNEADWVPPSVDLLEPADTSVKIDEKELHEKADKIKQKLGSFGIDVAMSAVNIGPSVMQYTLRPSDGVKLSKIMNLKNDLALALSAKSIRIQAPIPGTHFVGIEMPNDKRVTVRMKELVQSDAFAKIKSNLRLVLGRDVTGAPMVADLAKMPHLLVAGQTGSGKSVCINAFLLSLIYQNSPNDLRMILVDPKRVELVPYNGIPHLLTPVINDPEKVVSALKWALAEMTRRYTECAKVRVRNLEEYNAHVLKTAKPKKDGEESAGDEPEKMPYIVIVIDELADLMMVAGKEVEACICRLAQMARAVGIHLIVATQRPSVDVITGLIKANIPTRIAFRVAQGVDSKTILDGVGAEDLLGQGDMLFIPPGQSEPLRVQGAFVSTEEVKKVMNAIKLDIGVEGPEYNDDILDITKTSEIVIPGLAMGTINNDDNSDDATVLKAARVILESGRASASLLQRRLSLGYARAARVIDLMEERGFVGAADGAKPRPIYITAEKLTELETAAGGPSDPAVAARENANRILDEMEIGRNNY